MKRFVGYYNYTVILTLVSLVIVVFGMTQCLHGHYKIAIFCLMLSGVCDAFDGRIARTRSKSTEDERNYGIQLDSLCDMICFGLYPSLICYMLGCRGWLGIICICFYSICAVTRLAYFNVLEARRQQEEEARCAKSYHGLPVTSIAVILPVFFAIQYFSSPFVFYVALHIMLVGVGLAFVIDFKMPKPGLKGIVAIMVIMLVCLILVFAKTGFRVPSTHVYSNPIIGELTQPNDEEIKLF